MQESEQEDWVFPVRDPTDPRKVHPWFRDPKNHYRVAEGIELETVALRQSSAQTLTDFVQETERVSDRGKREKPKIPQEKLNKLPEKMNQTVFTEIETL